MLCEKCHRRQAEWGTLCEECEKEQASADRKKDIVRIVNRLKWYALWMAGEFLLVGASGAVISHLCDAPLTVKSVLSWAFPVAVGVALYEWWLWRGYASRIDKGNLKQVAYELVHSPKGYWKWEIRRRKEAYVYKPRLIGGTVMYITALRDLYREWQALEMLAEGSE